MGSINLSWDDPSRIPQEIEVQYEKLASQVADQQQAVAARGALSFPAPDRLSLMLHEEPDGKNKDIFGAFEEIVSRVIDAFMETLPEQD